MVDIDLVTEVDILAPDHLPASSLSTSDVEAETDIDQDQEYYEKVYVVQDLEAATSFPEAEAVSVGEKMMASTKTAAHLGSPHLQAEDAHDEMRTEIGVHSRVID